MPRLFATSLPLPRQSELQSVVGNRAELAGPATGVGMRPCSLVAALGATYVPNVASASLESRVNILPSLTCARCSPLWCYPSDVLPWF